MSLNLDHDHERLLSRFDSLVASGVVTYHPSRVTEIEDHGFKFRYEITESLAGKPAAELAIRAPELTPAQLSASRPQTFGSGSDIPNAHPDLLITTINDTHLLVVNKFAVFRPHLLLLTVDSYQRQHLPLSLVDLKAARTFLTNTQDRFYVIFNCGVNAGASRSHKHMQVLPHPDALPPTAQGWRLFPDYDPPLVSGSIPFVYFIRHFERSAVSGPELFDAYTHLLLKCRRVLNIPDDQVECPHNVVITTKWILTIPRSKENVDCTTANSAGMMGSVWLRNEKQLEKWMAQGPAWVLSQLGLPAEELPGG
ncbi:hypothetical protein A1O1_02305 [Capronia coronata CBS 617.96]|uniref:Uncharacterized protein n=1 Tax=Capronia coronata CBS 617.96 TaxID=1182541 RepID=W9YLZ9_9EURO|nr:uncharacterized protein A1O1_02305 [Capronia coronata CBS 617.96]EXJ93912.1 hypothetical protein A1O1_02305 [Capronia coronata CBS 617.96]